ncbi:MAG: glutamate--tRNA ligase [Longimicrobiales bacterium]|nr:glutamate--tRNA ligase [Longimicrobiales bacterium]
MTVRTRFAPSPTGRLHLGNVRTAIFNWLFARHHGGAFILRIEDTDLERNLPGAEAGLIEDLRWLGLEWEEGPDVGGPFGPYRQSERGEIHSAHARRLLDRGRAYPCFCTGEESMGEDRRYTGACRDLDRATTRARVDRGEPHLLRLMTPREGVIEVKDEVRGTITFPAKDIDDFVILRADGRATYNFGVVVDDMLMKISHVIRGAGHLSNTPKQVLIWGAFEAPLPCFAHLPDVLAPDGGKLSKRSGAAAVAELRAEGALPQAIVNYLSLLGWSHPEEREILSVDELADAVDLDRVGAADTAFDPEKMRWVGQQQMGALPDPVYFEKARHELQRMGMAGDLVDPLAELLRSRLATFGEIAGHLAFVKRSDEELRDALARGLADEKITADPGPLFAATASHLRDAPEWGPEAVRAAIGGAGHDLGIRGREVYIPLRLAWTGETHGPDLAVLVSALGRSEALRRLGAHDG